MSAGSKLVSQRAKDLSNDEKGHQHCEGNRDAKQRAWNHTGTSAGDRYQSGPHGLLRRYDKRGHLFRMGRLVSRLPDGWRPNEIRSRSDPGKVL